MNKIKNENFVCEYEPDDRDDMDSYAEIWYEVGLNLEPNKYAKHSRHVGAGRVE